MAGLSLNTQYDYNAADELTALTYPSGLQVDMPLDAAGRLTAITATVGGNTQQVVSSFSWQGRQLQSYQHGNGLSTTLSYDATGRLTSKQFGASNSFNNQLDNQGQITQQTWTQSGNQDVAAYEYDLLGRLSKDGSPDSSSWLYDYDAVGNRLSEQRDNATALTDYDYEANSNRMSQINTTAITLDTAGNTLNDGVRQYQYNAMNRLAQVNHTQNGLQANYTYNFLGQRVRKSISGSQSSDSRYFYGPQGELLGEYDALGNRVYEYIYRRDTEYPELMAVVNATGDILHVHTDHLMTPRQVTNSSQTVVWQWLSEAFGQTLANEDPDGDSQTITLTHRFPGQHYDSETGLHYNYFRYYAPATGRYITSDPIGLAGGMNTYAYVNNSSLYLTDPYGLRIVGSPGVPDNKGVGNGTGRVGAFACLGGCISYIQGDQRPQASLQPTVGFGLSICSSPKEPSEDDQPNDSYCEVEKQDCGIYDPECDNTYSVGASPRGRMGLVISINLNDDGSVCVNIGPHSGLPGPTLGLGDLF